MPKKTEKQKPDVFFVGMKDPIEIRRSILESSKEMVQYLQRFERFKKVRVEKSEEIKKLKAQIHEINILVKKLKSTLPKTALRAKSIKAAPKEKIKQAPEPVVEEPPKEEIKEATELQKLESELGEIENRLTKLV